MNQDCDFEVSRSSQTREPGLPNRVSQYQGSSGLGASGNGNLNASGSASGIVTLSVDNPVVLRVSSERIRGTPPL